MKRKNIGIDETKCTGCGQCIPDCPEGALQLIEGKARLVSDLFCDGLGACIGTCPEGAISIVEREASLYDEKAVMATIVRQGVPVIKAHLEHLAGNGQRELYNEAIEYLIEHTIAIPDHDNTAVIRKPLLDSARKKPAITCPPALADHHPFGACPGSAARSIPRSPHISTRQPSAETGSELRQWPVQLTLLNPAAPYFDNADLLVSADCVPFAFPKFHAEFLRDRIVIIFCQKLDADIDGYITKLAEIFTLHMIKSITVVHMEVPCCSGVRYVVDRALEQSGRKSPVTDTTITIDGGIAP
ncbi:MAG: 4Fe-4S dicluster domain-containing protein [Methanoregula sp.]|jgi:Pyruvate/2-oxoacid:ferredoxin oxidoreductase delta subunit